jgi:IS5 family transposase
MCGKPGGEEMDQTRKGKQWHFGMKLHIGVVSQNGLAHSAVVMLSNVHDKPFSRLFETSS